MGESIVIVIMVIIICSVVVCLGMSIIDPLGSPAKPLASHLWSGVIEVIPDTPRVDLRAIVTAKGLEYSWDLKAYERKCHQDILFEKTMRASEKAKDLCLEYRPEPVVVKGAVYAEGRTPDTAPTIRADTVGGSSINPWQTPDPAGATYYQYGDEGGDSEV